MGGKEFKVWIMDSFWCNRDFNQKKKKALEVTFSTLLQKARTSLAIEEATLLSLACSSRFALSSFCLSSSWWRITIRTTWNEFRLVRCSFNLIFKSNKKNNMFQIGQSECYAYLSGHSSFPSPLLCKICRKPLHFLTEVIPMHFGPYWFGYTRQTF